MGIGKPISSVYRLIPIVFFNNREKLKLPKNLSKYLSPTQGASKNTKLYFKVFKCQYHAAHGGICKNNKVQENRQNHQIQNPVLFKIIYEPEPQGPHQLRAEIFLLPFRA